VLCTSSTMCPSKKVSIGPAEPSTSRACMLPDTWPRLRSTSCRTNRVWGSGFRALGLGQVFQTGAVRVGECLGAMLCC
jgi:hypothetical protein